MNAIFASGRRAGALVRDDSAHRFIYDLGVPATAGVSLVMPTSEREYFATEPRVLHPVFDMSLPEGALRRTLTNMFSETVPNFDDFELYRIVGSSTIGRLRYVHGKAIPAIQAENIRDLLKQRDAGACFTEFFAKYAVVSGVSGVQPKVLVQDDGGLVSRPTIRSPEHDRLNVPRTTHLLKSFDSDEFPAIGLNEWLCLRAARAAGLDTVRADLSADGRVLAVERFDYRSDGEYLGFEDGCALAGMITRDKYVGSYEQLAQTLSSFITPEQRPAEMARFFRSLVLSMVVRNGDAHRKNFGLLYDNACTEARLAPVFDVITSTAYIKQDKPALLMDGSKRWPDNRRLEKFARARCYLSPPEAQTIMQEVGDGVRTTLNDLSSEQVLALDQSDREIIDRMKEAWSDGLTSIRLG